MTEKNKEDKYAKVNKNDVKGIVDDFISDKHRETISRSNEFEELMSFTLDDKQWTSIEKEDRISDGLPSLVLNESANFVDRYLARLFPRNQRTGILEVGVKTFNDKTGDGIKRIMAAYRRNYLPAILVEQGVDFLIGGAGCFYYPQNPITQKAEIMSLDPTKCYLSWEGNKLKRFAHKEKFSNGAEEIIYWDLNSYVYIHIRENGNWGLEIGENEFDFIPFSWIPCFPRPHRREGRSKIKALKSFDRENNRRFSDFSKRIADNTVPHVNVFSETAKKDDYQRGSKKISYFNKDDDVRLEELKESPEVLEFLKMWDSRLRRKTGSVDIGTSLKSVVSGISLSYQFSEMMDLIGKMRIDWDKGFRELNNAILNYEIGKSEYDSDPVYNPVLAFDSKQKVDEYHIMLSDKLISRKDAISELRAVEDPDEVISEIIEEDKLFEYLDKNKENKNGGEIKKNDKAKNDSGSVKGDKTTKKNRDNGK